ncbi:flagellin [Sphingomonas sp. AP4-R1]|nr:flagellin [Sphingomonas sp. AP4-R1]
MQTLMQSAMLRTQRSLADAQEQLSTTKKVQSYADLGTDSGRVLSARSMLAQYDAQSRVASRVDTTLSFYQSRLGQVDTTVSALRKTLLDVIGTGNASDLVGEASAAFDQFKAAMNAADGGKYLFAGGQTGAAPLVPQTLADTVGLDRDAAFTNDQTRLSARIAPGEDMSFGIVASDFGKNFVAAFRTLAEMGPVGERPTQAQIDAMTQAVSQMDAGLADLRVADAGNGRAQNRVDDMVKRADDRTLLLTSAVGDVEDADMGQVAIDISLRKTLLESSYSAFAQINGLSLANYLR